MADIKLNIAKDFSRCPGARYKSEGDFSGEELWEKITFTNDGSYTKIDA